MTTSPLNFLWTAFKQFFQFRMIFIQASTVSRNIVNNLLIGSETCLAGRDIFYVQCFNAVM